MGRVPERGRPGAEGAPSGVPRRWAPARVLCHAQQRGQEGVQGQDAVHGQD